MPAPLETFVALAIAFVLGTAIGFERQFRQRNAGLRTNVLVAVGAAAFARLGLEVNGHAGGSQIIAYVVSGIGFLGAGVIIKDGGSIRGLNTAATLWCSAAVGACSGGGYPIESVELAGFVLAGNTLLRPLVNWINRLPITQGETEALYRIHATCDREAVSDVRDLIDAVMTRHAYPIRDIEAETEGEDQIDVTAQLVPTTADPEELDQAVAELEASPLIRSATWSVSTTT